MKNINRAIKKYLIFPLFVYIIFLSPNSILANPLSSEANSILTETKYGKESVNLVKINHNNQYSLDEISVSIRFNSSDFALAAMKGDNSKTLPTDTMKNMVYVLGQKHPITPIESFASILAENFLTRNKQLEKIEIKIEQLPWNHLIVNGKSEPNSFILDGNEKRITYLSADRKGQEIQSGLLGVRLLKTTGNVHVDFLKDEYTTLKETEDRILSTRMDVLWKYKDNNIPFDECYLKARQAIFSAFSEEKNQSLQQTLYRIGNKILEACPSISEVHLVMENKHNFLFNLEQFNLKNEHQIFVPTEVPYGRMEATMKRTNNP